MKSYRVPKGFMVYGLAFLGWTSLMGFFEGVNLLLVAGFIGFTLMLIARLVGRGYAEKLVVAAFTISGISYLIVWKVPYVTLSFLGLGIYYISNKAVEAELMPFKILSSLRGQGIAKRK